jgi:hypothetical protein
MNKLTMVNFVYLGRETKKSFSVQNNILLYGSYHVESKRFYSIILGTYMILYLFYKTILLGTVSTNQFIKN